MQVPQSLQQHKGLLITLLGVILVAVLGLYLVNIYTAADSVTTTEASVNQSLLGQEFTLLLSAVSKEGISFRDTSFANSYYLRNAEDYTQIIVPSASRGRDNPFAPYYATPRSSR
jgi:hypothetical protein